MVVQPRIQMKLIIFYWLIANKVAPTRKDTPLWAYGSLRIISYQKILPVFWSF